MATEDFKTNLGGDEVLARSFSRVCGVLAAVERLEKPDLKNLVNKTDIPKRSILAMIDRLQREYHVVIERQQGRRYGFYRVVDWGVLNRERILESQKDG